MKYNSFTAMKYEQYKESEIVPNCGRRQKSFYGKARLIEFPNCEKYLKSYETIVCGIDEKGKFHRFWSGWSATTAKHVDSFRRLYAYNGIGKSEWMNLPIEG